MKQFIILLACFSLLSTQTLFSQTLKGKITSNTNEPIPYAVIYIHELAQGASANALGEFAISLKAGTYKCSFQSMGYEAKDITVTMDGKNQTLNIVLSEKPYMLDMSTASIGKAEDPAYPIMRKAIGMAPFHLNQVNEFTSTVYLKGSMEVKKISGLVKLAAKDELKETGVKEGETYFQESVNTVNFKAPDKYEQKIQSVSSTFPKGMSDLYLIQMNLNIYNKDLKTFVSPLSPNAFSYYKFTYEGCSLEGELLVNKIKVTPKIKNQLTVRGYIYIVDDYWCVKEFDFYGESTGMKYHNKQTFAEVRKDVFLPINYLFNFDISMMGNKGAVDYRSVVKYTAITLNPNAKRASTAKQTGATTTTIVPDELNKKQKKNADKIEALLSKNSTSNRDAIKLAQLMEEAAAESRKQQQEKEGKQENPLELKPTFKLEVDSLARKRDTSFWLASRPIPLSPAEVKSYAQRDSIRLVETRMDSISKARPITFLGLYMGKTYYLCDSSAYIRHYGLADVGAYYFHPADGHVYGQEIRFAKRFKDTTSFSANLSGIYAFNRKQAMGTLKLEYRYWLERRASLKLDGGRVSTDFEELNDLSLITNTYSAILAHRSYISLYEKTYANLYNTIDIANGLVLTTSVGYFQRKQLHNISEYSFLFRDRVFQSNTPNNVFVVQDPSIVEDGKAFIIDASLSYTPEYYYRKRGRIKQMAKSKYPTFTIGWRKGVSGILNINSSNFDLGTVGAKQHIDLGIMKSFSYKLEAGMFFSKENLHFADFKHFNNQRSGFIFNPFDNIFHMQQPYSASTNNWYFTANMTYTTPYLAIKYLPFLHNSMMVEKLHVGYIRVPHLKPETELGYSIGYNQLLSVGVFTRFEKLRYQEFKVKVSFAIPTSDR